MNKTCAILGCGWLGFPLARKLVKSGYKVHGSTTSAEKLNALEVEGIVPFQIALTEKAVEGKIEAFLENVHFLIIDIPPGLRKQPTSDFVQKIKNLLPFIEKSRVEEVVFVSSTSVFKNTDEMPIYKEDDKPNATSEAGTQLRAVEELLLENSNFKTTIVRFGGLLGGKRHPVKFLAGRENVSNPEAPVNLIRREDCIALLQTILESITYLPIVHGVFPYHPQKQFYYADKAKEFDLTEPQFNSEKTSVGKHISSEITIQALDFNFRYQP